MTESDLYRIFKKKVKGHHTRIENAVTSGVPDLSTCVAGMNIWIELKNDISGTLRIRPAQVVWWTNYVKNSGIGFFLYTDKVGAAHMVAAHAVLARCTEETFDGKHYRVSLKDIEPMTGWSHIGATLENIKYLL